jgi:hypothetical protein
VAEQKALPVVLAREAFHIMVDEHADRRSRTVAGRGRECLRSRSRGRSGVHRRGASCQWLGRRASGRRSQGGATRCFVMSHRNE